LLEVSVPVGFFFALLFDEMGWSRISGNGARISHITSFLLAPQSTASLMNQVSS